MNTEQFFYRNMMFSKKGNEVAIIDFENPEENKEVLEPWFGIVFMLADGQHTIEEMYNLLSQKYTSGPPADLLRTIVSVIERMAKSQLIILTEIKTELPYYLSMPYELLDWDKAISLIQEDQKKREN